jgi:peroxiredoxin
VGEGTTEALMISYLSGEQGKNMSELLQVSQTLPTLEAQTADGRRTTLQAHYGPKRTLLYFLHGTWCPECVGQYHLLQRYLPHIKEAGAELVVVTGEETDTLTAFLGSTQPALEYTVLADPKHSAYHAIKADGDTIAIIVDDQGVVRWFDRWPDHQDEPGYDIILQALRDVRDAAETGG